MAITYKNYLTANIGITPVTVYNPTTSNIQSTVIGFNISNTNTVPVTANVPPIVALPVTFIFTLFAPIGITTEPLDEYKIPSAILRASSPAAMYWEFVAYEPVVLG